MSTPRVEPDAPASNADDATLPCAVSRGDAVAFERLMRSHNRRLFRVARALLRVGAEAEDALQEAYLRAYRGLANFRGDSSIATWLTRIVVNECMSRMRRSARRENIVPIVGHREMAAHEDEVPQGEPSAVDDETPDRAFVRSEMRAMLERKIDELPRDLRTVFVMRAVEELSVEETAQCLGVPEATVRTRHFRARGLLREAIAQEIDVAERDVFDFDGPRCDRIVAAVLHALTSSA